MFMWHAFLATYSQTHIQQSLCNSIWAQILSIQPGKPGDLLFSFFQIDHDNSCVEAHKRQPLNACEWEKRTISKTARVELSAAHSAVFRLWPVNINLWIFQIQIITFCLFCGDSGQTSCLQGKHKICVQHPSKSLNEPHWGSSQIN